MKRHADSGTLLHALFTHTLWSPTALKWTQTQTHTHARIHTHTHDRHMTGREKKAGELESGATTQKRPAIKQKRPTLQQKKRGELEMIRAPMLKPLHTHLDASQPLANRSKTLVLRLE